MVMRNRVVAVVVCAALVVTGLVVTATPAGAVAPVTVTRVDSWARVTPNSSGVATVSYCPVADPCAFASPPANVVVTGRGPSGGTPSIPANLLAYDRTTTGFTVRAIDQSGAAIASTSITLSYYVAWAGYIDAGTGWTAANATVQVTTSSTDGYAPVTFDRALPATPTGIVASGVAPATGTYIAASLLVDYPTAGGFRVRVLNQTGAAVLGQKVTLSYHAVAGTRSVPVKPLTLLPPTLVRSNGARLQWRRGGGATFARYEVHRSTTSGFSPSADTLLATLGDATASSWQDSTAAPGTPYYYKLVVDGQASNEIAATTPAARQAKLTLQPGGREGKATYVAADRSSPAGCYDSYNYGSAAHLRMGTATNGVVHRPLLWFDLRDLPTDLPSGLSVTGATLTLWSRTSVPALPIQARRVTRAWREGRADYPGACDGSGASSKATQGGVGWSAVGGDVDATADASLTLTAHGPAAVSNTPDTINLLGLVRKWASGTPNHGVLLRLTDEAIPASEQYFDWFSDDADNPALRPSLTITFNDNSQSTGPRVALAAPGPGATVRGGAARLAATAADDGRVANLQFLVDGVAVGTRGISGSVAGKVAEIASSGENAAAGEVKENLNDGDASTKWLVFTSPAWAQYRLSAPAAVVHYALTSANDVPERDPRNWTLQGSQDGQSWATLDSRSGQVFTARSQRKEYRFSNTTGYLYYRLNITANNGAAIVQLAELELADSDTSPTRAISGSIAGKVAEIAASGEYAQAGEVKENLNDGDASTKWLVFTSTAWAQYRLSAPAAVVRYALTSANDVPERDPRNWTLQGSQDGQSWATLDSRSGQVFTARSQRKEYRFSNTTGYLYYRLNITANNGAAIVQLAELELSDSDTSPTRAISVSIAGKVAEIAASGEYAQAGEVKENLNDGDASTKWLVFTSTAWAQYRLSAPAAVVRYALTSANDVPERDPRNWTLQGSQDGQSWATLDSRSGEVFTARSQRKEYRFSNTTGYLYYRLNITANNGAAITQLAEWELV